MSQLHDKVTVEFDSPADDPDDTAARLSDLRKVGEVTKVLATRKPPKDGG